MNDYLEYQEWKDQIIYRKLDVVLPDGRTISKEYWITKDGFNNNEFNSFLFDVYNKLNIKQG